MRRAAVLFVLVVAVVAGCDLPEDPILGVNAASVVNGVVLLDANGSRTVDQADGPMSGVPVQLRLARTGALAASARSDATGRFRFANAPVGEYRVVIETGALGDTLELLGLEPAPFTLGAFDSAAVALAVTYPTVTLEQARALPPGRRVFTSGIALNARESFGDGVVHLKGQSLYLRATEVARANLFTGDSVRMLGRTARDVGLPILTDVTPFVLVGAASLPVPVRVTAVEGATARGGPLDAALVLLPGGTIADTTTQAGDFLVTTKDATGSVVLVFRSFLPVPRQLFDSARVVIGSATGLLRPTATTEGARWRIVVRTTQDVVLQAKPPVIPPGPGG